MAEPVTVERRGHVQVITINRPEARNALNGAATRAMAAAVDELDADAGLRVGVLTGAGGTFCSGMDLKGWMSGDKPTIEGRGFGGITITPPRKPLIAAVEGYALAGGFELMLACDLVVAGQGSKFGVPEVKRGLVAGGGAALLLPKRIPFAAAMELLLTGEPVTAARAAELGLVNRVVPDGTALDGALALAEADRGQRAAGGGRHQADRPCPGRLDGRGGLAAAGRAVQAGVRLGRRPGGRRSPSPRSGRPSGAVFNSNQ